MISIWMVYSAGVALLLGLAALAAERLCRASGRPTRWVWAAALATSLFAPAILTGFGSAGAAAGAAAVPAAAEITTAAPVGLPGRAAPVETYSSSAWVERALGLAWLTGSAGFGVILLLSAVSLARDRRGWRHGTVGGRPVKVSAGTGPAVAGFLWPEVVVPRWVLEWDAESQRLLVEHEAEHQRAGDTHLLLASLVGLLFAPWNPVLWWQTRRLRFAIEVDCDARVLRTRPSIQKYGELLIQVARCSPATLAPITAFSRSDSFLERRIRILASPERPPRRSAQLAVWALILLPPIAAFTLPPPEPPALGRLALATGEPQSQSGLDLATLQPSSRDPALEIGSDLTFTAIEVRPELRNPAGVAAAIQSSMAEFDGLATPGDTVVLWAFVDAEGLVRNTRLVSSSGSLPLDQAAREALLETARFTPARNASGPVPAWIQVPLSLQAKTSLESVRIAIAMTPPPPPPASIAGSAVSRPSTSGLPTLHEPMAFENLVARAYPVELREDGIRGTAVIWAFVDASGTVGSTRLATSSGNEQLDLIAREVVLKARFSAAPNPRVAAPAWVGVPVAFVPR